MISKGGDAFLRFKDERDGRRGELSICENVARSSHVRARIQGVKSSWLARCPPFIEAVTSILRATEGYNGAHSAAAQDTSHRRRPSRALVASARGAEEVSLLRKRLRRRWLLSADLNR